MDLSSILAFGIADLVLLQFSCKPFVSVDVNLDLERKPCLQLDMHQTEIPSIRIRQAAYSVLSLPDVEPNQGYLDSSDFPADNPRNYLSQSDNFCVAVGLTVLIGSVSVYCGRGV